MKELTVCRSRADRPAHGRRCPGQSDPYRRAQARIRQRIGRHDRAVRQAADRGDWAAMERHITLLQRDTASPPEAPPVTPMPDTMAGQYTPAATVDWSDDDLILAWGELADDPAAQDQIMATLDWRAQLEAARDAELAEHAQRQQAERDAREQAWREAQEREDASPLTNPVCRPIRRLTPEQACREEYDSHLATAYEVAETDCRGQLLNRAGLAKGIDPQTLFTGPASRVRAYASEELRTWFGRHGRITYAEWKYQWLGRDSDRAAARTARHASIGEVTA
jgi:hypothetical protein